MTAVPVKEQEREISILKTGALAPFKEAKVISVASGNVQRLSFNLGDNVEEGQILAVIDTKLLQLDLQRSESNVAKLRRDLQTYTELLEGNAATQEKVNEIRQNYQVAVNEAQQIRRQITDASIKAPTTGVVGSKLVEEGVYVTAGSEIASVVNLSQLKVQVNLTESEVYQVAVGQQVKLTTDVYPGKEFSGTIYYISPQADQSHNYRVEIIAANVKDAPLRSGTFINADFSRKTHQNILLIPREALTESARDASVYVVSGNKAVLRQITTGADYGNSIQVLKGLEKGEVVITSGQINLRDGALISISK
ncbi:efflux RND transporter periplasmic adaptor subunit [Flavobacterium rhizosphaerae]|uniref:efflux RND transporter periplasmic adaptor subunit n=1 Tax=Flavobacterium rhizosphaerae TaxID=3163298 RepID=UPI0038B59735